MLVFWSNWHKFTIKSHLTVVAFYFSHFIAFEWDPKVAMQSCCRTTTESYYQRHKTWQLPVHEGKNVATTIRNVEAEKYKGPLITTPRTRMSTSFAAHWKCKCFFIFHWFCLLRVFRSWWNNADKWMKINITNCNFWCYSYSKSCAQ